MLVAALMLLQLGLGLWGFELVALDADRYSGYQHELNVYESVGVSEAELRDVQRLMAQYLGGAIPAEQMNREVTLKGVVQPIFNEKEMAHMADVVALFSLARGVKWWALGIGTLLCAVALMLGARWRWAGLIGLGVWLGLALGFGAAYGFNFERIFIRFHQLLFTNKLWLLDPRTDAMIRMYPEQFFAWMARDIGVYFGIGALIPAAVPLAVLRR